MLEENRRLMIGAAAIVVALVVIGGFLLFRGDPESRLTVTSIPNDLTLTLDGHQIPASGEVKVKAGEHTLVGERKGFQSHTTTFKAQDGGPMSTKMYLYADSDDGREWTKNHPEQEQELEAEAGRRYDETQQRLEEKYPILNVLPYIGPGFKASYTQSKSDPSNPEAISIKIKLFGSDGRDKALEWITANGWDPNTLDIIWTTKD